MVDIVAQGTLRQSGCTTGAMKRWHADAHAWHLYSRNEQCHTCRLPFPTIIEVVHVHGTAKADSPPIPCGNPLWQAFVGWTEIDGPSVATSAAEADVARYANFLLHGVAR